jgi:Tol biopolymer transport system component/DNA-binding winged helix-turn-helix (wHTH) protein
MPRSGLIPYIEVRNQFARVPDRKFPRQGSAVTSMNQPEKFPPPFRLGPWLVSPELNRIQGQDGPVQIEPRVMKVLLCLAEKPGTVLTRLQLLDEVWADSVVGEEILTRAVSELRRVFGDSAREPRYIETIRNHGYRLISPVEPVPEEAEPAMVEPVVPDPVEPAEPATLSEPEPETARRPAGWPMALIIVAILAGMAVLGPGFWMGRNQEKDSAQVVPAMPAVPLTSYPGREWHPALSPDGTRVAFIRREPEAAGSDLYLKQVGSEATLRLTDDPAWNAWPAWSPDGQSIAFVRGEEGQTAICMVSSLGGTARRLTGVASLVDGLDWSTDGQSLVFSAVDPKQGEYRLFLLSLTDLVITAVPGAFPGGAGDFQPRFSPDGRHLAWMGLDQAGANHLYVRSLEKGPARPVTRGLAAVQGLAWTPDGGSLVYAASPGGSFGLWQVPVMPAGQPLASAQLVPTAGDFAWNPSIARQTGDLAFEQVRVDQDLWRVKVLSRDPWQLETAPFLQSTRWEYEARFSPDGKQVAFVSARSGSPEIWLADQQGQNLQQLTRLQASGITNLRWGPGGRQIAFNAVEEGGPVIMVGEVTGTRPRRLTPTGGQEILADWAHDGKTILLAVDGPGGWEIKRRVPGQDETTPVTLGGGVMAQESKDGSNLFFTRPGRSGLWRAPLTGGQMTPEKGEPELIIPELSGQDRRNWLLHGDHVLWVLRSGGSAILADYDPATGQSSFITDLPRFSGSGLGVSPRGDVFIYPRAGEMSGDLLLIKGSGK